MDGSYLHWIQTLGGANKANGRTMGPTSDGTTDRKQPGQREAWTVCSSDWTRPSATSTETLRELLNNAITLNWFLQSL